MFYNNDFANYYTRKLKIVKLFLLIITKAKKPLFRAVSCNAKIYKLNRYLLSHKRCITARSNATIKITNEVLKINKIAFTIMATSQANIIILPILRSDVSH